jgi:hypothetical protein
MPASATSAITNTAFSGQRRVPGVRRGGGQPDLAGQRDQGEDDGGRAAGQHQARQGAVAVRAGEVPGQRGDEPEQEGQTDGEQQGLDPERLPVLGVVGDDPSRAVGGVHRTALEQHGGHAAQDRAQAGDGSPGAVGTAGHHELLERAGAPARST